MATSYEFCTMDALAGDLREPFGAVRDGARIAGALAEAAALAERAFKDDDRAARSHAEKLLHLLHHECNFSAPAQTMAAAVWSTLAGAKMAELRRRCGGTAPFPPAELAPRLTEAVKARGALNHRLIDAMTRGTDLTGVRLWARNWFGSALGFVPALMSLARRCPHGASKVIISNIGDELAEDGSERWPAHHDMLRARFLESLGIFYDATEARGHPDMLTEAFAILNFRCIAPQLDDPAFALGAFYSIEANWHVEAGRIYPNLLAQGHAPESAEIFLLHNVMDVEHAREWLEVIEQIPLRPADCATILDGALCQLQLRNDLYDAVLARLER